MTEDLDPLVQGRRCQALWQCLVHESIAEDGRVLCADVHLELAGLDPQAVRERERRGLVRRLDGRQPRLGPVQQRRRRKPAAKEDLDLVLSLLPAAVEELAEVLEWPVSKVRDALHTLRAEQRAVYVFARRQWMTREQWTALRPDTA